MKASKPGYCSQLPVRTGNLPSMCRYIPWLMRGLQIERDIDNDLLVTTAVSTPWPRHVMITDQPLVLGVPCCFGIDYHSDLGVALLEYLT
jgi:hypothetical protein